MIDVAVSFFEPPNFGIFAEVLFHVLMNELLKVEAHFAKSADHDVGANSSFDGDVAIRIIQSDIFGIIGLGDSDL